MLKIKALLSFLAITLSGCALVHEEEMFKEVNGNDNPELATLQGIAHTKAMKNNCSLNDEQKEKVNKMIEDLEKVLNEYSNRTIHEGSFMNVAILRYSSIYTEEKCKESKLEIDSIDI